MNTEIFMLRGQEINLGNKLNPEYLPDTCMWNLAEASRQCCLSSLSSTPLLGIQVAQW